MNGQIAKTVWAIDQLESTWTHRLSAHFRVGEYFCIFGKILDLLGVEWIPEGVDGVFFPVICRSEIANGAILQSIADYTGIPVGIVRDAMVLNDQYEYDAALRVLQNWARVVTGVCDLVQAWGDCVVIMTDLFVPVERQLPDFDRPSHLLRRNLDRTFRLDEDPPDNIPWSCSISTIVGGADFFGRTVSFNRKAVMEMNDSDGPAAVAVMLQEQGA